MIHIFRIFENELVDFLEFVDKQDLVSQFYQQRNEVLYDWKLMDIEDAMAIESRSSHQDTLRSMQGNGDLTVVFVKKRGELNWFSLSHHGERGIPSVQSVALDFFTDPAVEYRITLNHHEVFDVVKEARFRALGHQVIDSVLERVRGTSCEEKLDRYVDLNLQKLSQYGTDIKRFHGSYTQIKNKVKEDGINCPFYGQFFHQLMDVCMEKEYQLLGENRIHAKDF